MKFIFPQNYNLSSKILGIIDYPTAFFNVAWGSIVLFLLNLFFNSLNVKIFFFIVLVFPVFIFSIVGINGENIIYVISYLIKFFIKPKILF